jgi:membrane-associated phospholipid phosphatase
MWVRSGSQGWFTLVTYISNFADEAVVLPLALVVALLLALAGWWRGLAAWIVSVGVTLATMLLLKIVGAALAHGDVSQVISPSGHVAASCMVYGGLGVVLLRGRLPGLAVATIPAAVILVIGFTRLWLEAHTLMEVVIGAGVGALGVATLALLAGVRPRMAAWPLVAGATCTMLAFHGLHIPAEEVIRSALDVR